MEANGLRRLGYSHGEMTGHGNEQGWYPDLIEVQLAHAERNKVMAEYNRSQRLPERRKMMQAWADYLDSLKAERTSYRSRLRGAEIGVTLVRASVRASNTLILAGTIRRTVQAQRG